MSANPATMAAGPSQHLHAPTPQARHHHNFLAEPEHDPAAELELVRSISPRLRSSRDDEIARELEAEVAQEDAGNDSQREPTTTPPAAPPLGPPPDGGLEAWLVVAGAFLSLFCIFGLGACMSSAVH